MNNKVSIKEKLCYGIGSGGGNIITQILGTFLASYYTDTVGIAAAAIGTMMLLTRLLDGVSDVVMGGIVDRTNTKWGKARPWLLISAPLICVGLVLTFNVPASMSSGAKLVYAYLTYIFLNCITYTAYMISHTSLLARMTLDVHDRQTMTSLNQIINNVVQLVVTGFTMVFVTSWGWKMVSVAYGIITAAMILICFIGTREHISMEGGTEEVRKVEVVPLSKAVPALLKNKYFEIVICERWAKEVSEVYCGPVVIEAGIHYDNITKAQIREILEMLDKELNGLIEYIKRKEAEKYGTHFYNK